MLHADIQLYPLRTLRRCICALAVVLIASCAAPIDPVAKFPAIPHQAQVADVPRIQQDAFYCGPAAIAMVAQWAGLHVSQDEVAALSFSTGAKGTYQADMIGASRRLGLLAVEVNRVEDVMAEVAAGHPVIVFQNLGLGVAPVWHYGVVTGYDFDKDAVFLNSGQQDQMVLPFDLFIRTWERGGGWGLVVMPAGQLPKTGDEVRVLSATAGLERVAQYRAAELSYAAGAQRWPENWLWQFGLGNTRYSQGNLTGARAALRRARALGPDVPEVRANLAHVQAELAAH